MAENPPSDTELIDADLQGTNSAWWQQDPGVRVAQISLDALLHLYQQDRPPDEPEDFDHPPLIAESEKLAFSNNVASAVGSEGGDGFGVSPKPPPLKEARDLKGKQPAPTPSPPSSPPTKR